MPYLIVLTLFLFTLVAVNNVFFGEDPDVLTPSLVSSEPAPGGVGAHPAMETAEEEKLGAVEAVREPSVLGAGSREAVALDLLGDSVRSSVPKGEQVVSLPRPVASDSMAGNMAEATQSSGPGPATAPEFASTAPREAAATNESSPSDWLDARFASASRELGSRAPHPAQAEPVASEGQRPAAESPDEGVLYSAAGPTPVRVPPAPNAGEGAEPLAPAAPSEQVEKAQQLLARLGYGPGRADGVLGPQTERAVRAFQKSSGSPIDGRVSPELVAYLEDAVGKLAPEASPRAAAVPARTYGVRPATGSDFVSVIAGSLQQPAGIRTNTPARDASATVDCRKNPDYWVYDRVQQVYRFCAPAATQSDRVH